MNAEEHLENALELVRRTAVRTCAACDGKGCEACQHQGGLFPSRYDPSVWAGAAGAALGAAHEFFNHNAIHEGIAAVAWGVRYQQTALSEHLKNASAEDRADIRADISNILERFLGEKQKNEAGCPVPSPIPNDELEQLMRGNFGEEAAEDVRASAAAESAGGSVVPQADFSRWKTVQLAWFATPEEAAKYLSMVFDSAWLQSFSESLIERKIDSWETLAIASDTSPNRGAALIDSVFDRKWCHELVQKLGANNSEEVLGTATVPGTVVLYPASLASVSAETVRKQFDEHWCVCCSTALAERLDVPRVFPPGPPGGPRPVEGGVDAGSMWEEVTIRPNASPEAAAEVLVWSFDQDWCVAFGRALSATPL